MNIDSLREVLDAALGVWSWQLSLPQRCEGSEERWIAKGRLADERGIYREGAGMGESPCEAANTALAHASELFGVRPSVQTAQGVEQEQQWKGKSGSRPIESGGGITDRQAKAIMAISRALGWAPEKLAVWLHDEFKVSELEQLTKSDASSAIDALRGHQEG